MYTKKQSFENISNRPSFWMILFVLVVGTLFSSLIPPFQSPDEFDHIKRAYFLSKGTILLDAPEKAASGGMIDTGLAAYFAVYSVLPFKPDRKISAGELDLARNIGWTGTKEFSPAPGTGYYFPIIYMPQAIGLALGETFGLTIDISYRLARFLALATVALLLFFAFNVYNANPLTVALLIIPMSVFQFSSASIDGISTALAILSVSTFLRISNDRESANPWLFYTLTLIVFILSTSRIHLLPLLLCAFMAGFYLKKYRYFIIFVFSSFLIFVWVIISTTNTVDNRLIKTASLSSIVLFYITSPIVFLRLLIDTLSDSSLASFYIESFFGILGWLDSSFSKKIYNVFLICTVLIGLLSISLKNWKTELIPRSILFLSAIASILLIFFALLVTWNPHPARIIQGVQGRYFLIPIIMIAYAISGGSQLNQGILRRIALFLVLILGAVTIFFTPRLLIERYYLGLG